MSDSTSSNQPASAQSNAPLQPLSRTNKNGYYKPFQDEQDDVYYDLQLEIPLVSAAPYIKDAERALFKGALAGNQTYVVNLLKKITEAGYTNSTLAAFVAIMNNEQPLATTDVMPDNYDILLKKWKNCSIREYTEAELNPEGTKPIERDIIGSASSNMPIAMQKVFHMVPGTRPWLRQVRRSRETMYQLALIALLGNSLRDPKVMNRLTLKPNIVAPIVAPHADSVKSIFVKTAKRLSAAYLGRVLDNLEGVMEEFLKTEDTPDRNKAVVMYCVAICELAAVSSSFFGMKYATRLAVGLQMTNTNKTTNIEKSKVPRDFLFMLSGERSKSLMTRPIDAKNTTRDLVLSMFMNYMQHSCMSISTFFKEFTQVRSNDALQRVVSWSTKIDSRGNMDDKALARDICCIVVQWGRTSALAEAASKLRNTIADTLSAMWNCAMGIRNLLPNFEFSFNLPSYKGTIDAATRNKLVQMLYRFHGFPVKMHPMNCKTKMVSGCFFMVHAPLCTMIIDRSISTNGATFPNWHMKMAPKNVNTKSKPLSANNYDEAMGCVPENKTLERKCWTAVLPTSIHLDSAKAIFDNRSSSSTSDINAAARIIYNAILVQPQYKETADDGAKAMYRLLLGSNTATTLTEAQKNQLTGGMPIVRSLKVIGGPTQINEHISRINALNATIKHLKEVHEGLQR